MPSHVYTLTQLPFQFKNLPPQLQMEMRSTKIVSGGQDALAQQTQRLAAYFFFPIIYLKASDGKYRNQLQVENNTLY